jgi:hypothetical protein
MTGSQLGTQLRYPTRCAALVLTLLAGCATSSAPHLHPAIPGMTGTIHGGQQPIVGASIQLYAVGTTADGSSATPLLTSPVPSDANGNFTITGLFTCPSASALVYLVGIGGSPSSGITNPQIALMVALGPCGNLTPTTFLSVNEVTTVAAVYSLSAFITSPSAIGSGSSDASALASAFANSGYIASPNTGTAPGTPLANYTAPTAQINTIANLLAACINSPGGTSGDGSTCGTLFALTLPSGNTPPTNAIAALLNLALHPALNTAALFNLIPPTAPFQPAQTQPPPDFAIRFTANSQFTIAPSALSFTAAFVGFPQALKTITVSNASAGTVGLTSTAITGINAADFAIIPQGTASDCGVSLAPASTCTVSVAFTPSAVGARAAYFILNNTSANPVLAVSLAGQGTAAAAGPVTVSPSSLSFTLVNMPQPVTLTNNGAAPVAIGGFPFSSPGFSQTNTCGTTLPAGSSCTINVAATALVHTASATLSLIDNAASSPQSVALSFSNATTPSMPASIDFGGWSVGTSSRQDFIQITGPGISGSYNFSISGANSADFSFTTSASGTGCNYNYRNRILCYLFVQFKPSATGSRTANLTIDGVGNIPLLGTGDPVGVDFGYFQQPGGGNDPTVYTAALSAQDFGSAVIGGTATRTFDVVNTGTVPSVNLQPPVLSGPNAADFSIDAVCASIPCSPTVSFKAAGLGLRTATLAFTDTGNNVTHSVALTGHGTTPPPVISIPDVYFSNVPVGTVGPSVPVTVTAYNGAPVTANFTPIPTPGPTPPFLFTQGNTCASTPCQLMVAYAPTSPTDGGGINANLNVTDTVGQVSSLVQIYGQSAPFAHVSASPLQLNFNQAVGTTSVQTITVQNDGTVSVALSASLSSASSYLSYVSHCTPQVPMLAPGATCTIDLTFAPTGAASQNYGTLTLTSPSITYPPSITIFAYSF